MSSLTAFESASVTGLFLAGLLASLHCAGMCGPLACAACGLSGGSRPGSRGGGSAITRTLSYHLTRIGAYSVLGAIAAALGKQPLAWLGLSGKPLVLWAAVALIVGAVVVEWLLPERRLSSAKPVAPVCGKLKPIFSRGSWVVGLATPLLPCGVLYSALGVAALSGNALMGAVLMIAFGLGTVPLLAVAQLQWAKWSPLLGSRKARLLRVGIAVLFAAALAWRGGLFSSPATDSDLPPEAHCPLCVQHDAAPAPVTDAPAP
jgi:sulfite exporter TauE/SafE